MQDNRRESPWKQITLFLLTIGVLVLCALLLQPFFSAIVVAIVLAVVTRRPYDWLVSKMKNRSVCAAISLIVITLAVIVPTFFLAQELGRQAFATINDFRSGAHHEKITGFIANRPGLAARIESITSSIDVDNTVREGVGYLGSHLADLLGNSVRIITQLIIMLFLLFFLLRDRALALTALRSMLPLHNDETTELMNRVGDTILASALGRLVIAAVQGILAGLAFWVLGVPAVMLWAFTLTVCAHDSSLRHLPGLGTRRDLPGPHRPLGQSSPARHLGRLDRQHHRQHPLSDSGRLAPARSHRDDPAFGPGRNCRLRPHRHRPWPRPLHYCGHAFRHLARPAQINNHCPCDHPSRTANRPRWSEDMDRVQPGFGEGRPVRDG